MTKDDWLLIRTALDWYLTSYDIDLDEQAFGLRVLRKVNNILEAWKWGYEHDNQS